MENIAETYRMLTNANLEIYCAHYLENAPQELQEAVRYSVLGRGKRVRPTLMFLSAKMLGIDQKAIIPLAMALEFIHNYSLVHDDLPAMDNDDYRSGQLSTHKKFGEAMAILAGDALLTMSFEVMADALRAHPEQAKAVAYIAKSAGSAGMIGGQVLDINPNLTEDVLLKMYALKTGALLKAAILAPAYAGNVSEHEVKALDMFASYVGLSFQIADDIIDLKEGEKKTTFAVIHGEEEARGTLKTFQKLATDSLNLLVNRDTTELVAFCDSLSNRLF